jgi:diguanylate cyclase
MPPQVSLRVLLLLASLFALPALAQSPLELDDRAGRIEAWPALSMLSDPSHALELDEVRARRDAFGPPDGARGTLGLRKDAVWLHLPLQVAPDSDGRWMLDINYAVLNRVDVYLLRDGVLQRRLRLGNMQPAAERPFDSRSHAAPLTLEPGQRYELYLRVQTLGGMVLPIAFYKPSVFHAASIDEQMLQGLLTGLGLFLLLYSLAQWLSVRESMYLKYALLISGSLMFSVTQFGLGAHYLWTDNLWLERHVAGVAALVASAGTFLFVEEVLAGPERRRWFSPVMKAGAATLLAVAVVYMLGWIDVHVVSWVVGTLGLAPALMGLPGAVQRARRGDQVGWYFLVAWLGYFVSTWIMVSLIKGRLPADWWTLHSFQIGATLDMLLFMRVMSLRLQAIHDAARHAASERDALRSLALTDALTGLPNRRGLALQIEQRLPRVQPDHLLALFMLDLDGFKQVNDQHGHDVGDELLVAAARRLKATLREDDVVARLGGDEFIVAASGLRSVGQAEALGRDLLKAFESPFDAGGASCRVGLTVGYVLAPLDGEDVRALLKAADLAMYGGKMAGKNCVRRAPPAVPNAAESAASG